MNPRGLGVQVSDKGTNPVSNGDGRGTVKLEPMEISL